MEETNPIMVEVPGEVRSAMSDQPCRTDATVRRSEKERLRVFLVIHGATDLQDLFQNLEMGTQTLEKADKWGCSFPGLLIKSFRGVLCR